MYLSHPNIAPSLPKAHITCRKKKKKKNWTQLLIYIKIILVSKAKWWRHKLQLAKYLISNKKYIILLEYSLDLQHKWEIIIAPSIGKSKALNISQYWRSWGQIKDGMSVTNSWISLFQKQQRNLRSTVKLGSLIYLYSFFNHLFLTPRSIQKYCCLIWYQPNKERPTAPYFYFKHFMIQRTYPLKISCRWKNSTTSAHDRFSDERSNLKWKTRREKGQLWYHGII